ncbi:MAG: glycosyltransferase [Acutalibacteraceae bacterium]
MIKIFMIGMSTDKGGVEAYIANLCSCLDKRKYEITYCWPEMVIDGKRWICPANRHNYIKYRAFWKKFYRENRFDVLYMNTCDVVSIDQLKFAKMAGIPVRIIHSHSTANQQEVGQKMSLFHRLSEKSSRANLHRYATHLFACSKSAGDWMFDGRDYRIIKNGISMEKYGFNPDNRSKIRKNHGIENEALIGVVGRLDPPKNPLFSVDIAEATVSKNPNAKIVFIGDGELRAEVENRIAEKNIKDNVILTGAVDNVNEWLSAIDCILMPSLFEGLPFALVEAQAAGLHCVVSSAVSDEANITGLVEYLDLDESTEKWAETALSAAKKERVDNTRQLIDAGYSIAETAKAVSEIIENSLGKA